MEESELVDGKVSLVLSCLKFKGKMLPVDKDPSQVEFPWNCLVNEVNG